MPHSIQQLVLGTHNQKKRQELVKLVATRPIRIKSLTDFDSSIEVEETGSTFDQNACLKASEQAKVLSEWVLAEDSGIVVDVLDGRPGVYSARFSGPNATDQSNNELLLAELSGVPRAKRTAHYVCQLALADPEGNIQYRHQEICRGLIREAASGTNGFGYDPLFELAEYHQTFGELGASVKNILSHRARAMRQFLRFLDAANSKVVSD